MWSAKEFEDRKTVLDTINQYIDNTLYSLTPVSFEIPFLKESEMPTFLFLKIFYFDTERESISRGNSRQSEREKQTPHQADSPTLGSIPGSQDHDLSQRQTVNQLSHPGTLLNYILVKIEKKYKSTKKKTKTKNKNKKQKNNTFIKII